MAWMSAAEMRPPVIVILDHGQGHALGAIAEQREVAALDREQAVVEIVEIDVAGEDRLECGLRGAVVVLAAPQRVVGVEPDQPDAHFTGTS